MAVRVMRLSPVGEIARREWTRLAHRFRGIDVSDFVVMPNHIHGIVVISDSRRGTAVDSMDIDTDLFRRAPTDESQRWGMAMDAKMPHTEASRRAPTIFAIIRVHSWLIYSISARNKPCQCKIEMSPFLQSRDVPFAEGRKKCVVNSSHSCGG